VEYLSSATTGLQIIKTTNHYSIAIKTAKPDSEEEADSLEVFVQILGLPIYKVVKI
jgi:hypothetical protein